MADPTREAHLGGVLRYVLAAASLGAGLIHVTAIFDHWEHPVVATFFVLLTAAQLAWAVAVVLRPAPGLLKAGAAMSLGVVALWLITRTTGLPGIPGAEDREAFGLKDGMASALEVILAGGIAAQFAAWGPALRLASGRFASGLAVSAIGLLTAAGLSAPGHHHHEGAGPHHAGSMAAGHHDDRAEEAHSHSGGADSGHEHSAAAADHGAGGHDHPAAGGEHAAAATHDHAAGSDHQHEDGHLHEAAGHVHGDPAASLALAAGETHADAEHDHDVPGHVHDPSHHHHHGPSSQPESHRAGPDHQAGHDSGHAHEHETTPGADNGHDHSAPGEEAHDHDPGHGHDSGGHHEEGHGHDHGDGSHHDDNACRSPLPENRVVTTLQEGAQFFLGVECLGASNATNPIRSFLLHRSLLGRAEHFDL